MWFLDEDNCRASGGSENSIPCGYRDRIWEERLLSTFCEAGWRGAQVDGVMVKESGTCG
jgi:hypothetical protein